MKVTVAAACVPDHKGDRDKNLAAALAMIEQLAQAGAQIVVTPEACLQGYAAADKDIADEQLRELAEPFDGPYAQAFRDAAKENAVFLVAGYDRRDGERIFNTAEFIAPDGTTIGVYDKTHTGTYPDTRVYTPGASLPVFDTPFGKIGLLICIDRSFAENWRMMMLQGAKVVLIPSNGGYGELNTHRLQVMAFDQCLCCVFAHPRRGLVIDTDSNILDHDREHARPYAMAQLDLDPIEKKQDELKKRRRPDLYTLLN